MKLGKLINFKLDASKVKGAAKLIKTALVLVANANDAVQYKRKAKVDKVLQGAYKAADVVDRSL